MDSITISAIAMALLFLVGWLLSRSERRDLKREYNEGLAFARHNHAVDIRRIVDRLSLRFIDLPPPNQAMYSKVVDLYDKPDFMIYPQRIAWAREYDKPEYTYYWNVESANEFEDDELIALWLAAIIRAPLDVKDFD